MKMLIGDPEEIGATDPTYGNDKIVEVKIRATVRAVEGTADPEANALALLANHIPIHSMWNWDGRAQIVTAAEIEATRIDHVNLNDDLRTYLKGLLRAEINGEGEEVGDVGIRHLDGDIDKAEALLALL